MRLRPRRTAATLAAVAIAGTACTAPTGPFVNGLARPAARTGAAPGEAPRNACPAAYAAPDPNRPRVTLTFDLADDLATARGTERVVFTPDLPVTELVFRLTANTRPSVAKGNRIEVTSASSDPSGGERRFEPANAAAGTQGGLLVLPLGREVPAGQQVTAQIGFTLTLGQEAFDRFGRTDSYAWWGSGQPLLAWERGAGWHREPMLGFTAESATSEAAAVDLTVTAPARMQALTSGVQDPPVGTGGRRRWHAVADRARDVSVALGPFRLRQARAGDTTVIVGAQSDAEATRLLPEATRAVRELSARYGPAPFPVINLARLPLGGGGIEYPGSILMLDSGRLVTVHEVAHQWFYAMVGNSQARDPWLDEAFASWAEESVDGNPTDATALGLPGRVGGSTADFGGSEARYYATVYGKGAAALEAAQTAVGKTAFIRAIRCYVNANAWRIARPADVAAALAGLPRAVAVLKRAGALP